MGFQVVVMFIDSYVDDVIYVRDVEVCVECMICYIPWCICYGSENFGLGSLPDDYVGLAGATPQFYSVAPHRYDYRFVDESFVFYR
jgi:hypothetical protein